jgi:outer membrane immunogenic protein
MMLRTIIIGAVSAIAMASSAFAADIYKNDAGSLKDTPYTPAFSWTGFYLGANVGYAWGDTDISSNNDGFDEDEASIGYDTDGVIAGGQLGYNWQRGRFVFGLEGEIGYLGAEGDKRLPEADDGDNFGETEFGAYGVLAGRLGIASDRALFYVKGGWALASIDTKAGDLDEEEIDPSKVTNLDETLSGYAIGGGVEYALSQNWTVKGEYLYMNFGDEKSSNADGDTFKHEIDLHTAKVGVNYKFGGGYEALK